MLRRGGAALASMPLFESLRSLGFESSMGFLGTGGAGFRVTTDVEDAADATLEALDFFPEAIVVVLPESRLLSNVILASGSIGGESMCVDPVEIGNDAF